MSLPVCRSTFQARSPRTGVEGHYKIQQWETRLGTIVLMTELPGNPGVSVTNAVEWLIPMIARALSVCVEDTIWIEHYPESPDTKRGPSFGTRPTFDRVRLDASGHPSWEHFPDSLLAGLLDLRFEDLAKL